MNAREREVVQKLVDAAYEAKRIIRQIDASAKDGTVFAQLVISIGAVENVLALDDVCPPTPRNDG